MANSTDLKGSTTNWAAVSAIALTSGITRLQRPICFPRLSRSLRRAAFGYSMDDAGAMHFRQLLPDGKQRSGFAAADGQMGQIMHAYLDWRLSGDTDWLRQIWPRVKKALEFAWMPGGWDADRDGVMEGVQHNTYDVEFYGPNPHVRHLLSGRPSRRRGDGARGWRRGLGRRVPASVRKRQRSGSTRICSTANTTFRRSADVPKDEIAPASAQFHGRGRHGKSSIPGRRRLPRRSDGGAVSRGRSRAGRIVEIARISATALESIYRYNYKRTLFDHDSVQRTFALNDEAALVICDYGKGEAAAHSVPVLRGGDDRIRVLDGRSYALRGHGAGRSRVHSQHSHAV